MFFLPGTGATGSFSWSAFTHKLQRQKVRLPVVKMGVASVLQPGVPVKVVKGTVESSRKQEGQRRSCECVGKRGVQRSQQCLSRECGVQGGLPSVYDKEHMRVQT